MREGKGERVAHGRELGQQAESEEGRERERNFLLFFQVDFPKAF
jgi:hypothetical protein